MKEYKFFEVIFSIAEMSEKIKAYHDKAYMEKVYKLIDKVIIKIEGNNRLFEDYKYFRNINVSFRHIYYAYTTIQETIVYLEESKAMIYYDEADKWVEFGIIGEYFDKLKYILRKLYNLRGFMHKYVEE